MAKKKKTYMEGRMDEFLYNINEHVPPSARDDIEFECDRLAEDIEGRLFDQVQYFFETWIGRCYEARLDCRRGQRLAA